MKMYKTDANTYTKEDSGCPEATKFLGHQSFCLDCPFWDKKTYWDKTTRPSFCVYDPGNGRKHLRAEMRNKQIIKMRYEGKTLEELARIFRLSHFTIRKILGDYTKE